MGSCPSDVGNTGGADECTGGQRGDNDFTKPKHRIGRNGYLGLRVVWKVSAEFGWERRI